MGNNVSRSTQWAPDVIKSSGPVCGVQQDKCPFKICNSAVNHPGDHCNQKQAGGTIVNTFWSRL